MEILCPLHTDHLPRDRKENPAFTSAVLERSSLSPRPAKPLFPVSRAVTAQPDALEPPPPPPASLQEVLLPSCPQRPPGPPSLRYSPRALPSGLPPQPRVPCSLRQTSPLFHSRIGLLVTPLAACASSLTSFRLLPHWPPRRPLTQGLCEALPWGDHPPWLFTAPHSVTHCFLLRSSLTTQLEGPFSVTLKCAAPRPQ